MSDLTGSTIDSYQLEELLGIVDGVTVYRGVHVDLDQLAAVKVISPDLKVNPDYPDRFFPEAERIAVLDHPNVAEVYDIGEYEGDFYFIMEWLKDGSLRTLLQR